MRPLLGTLPTTQACALTGNRTSDPLVYRLALSPLSHTSQGMEIIFRKQLGQCKTTSQIPHYDKELPKTVKVMLERRHLERLLFLHLQITDRAIRLHTRSNTRDSKCAGRASFCRPMWHRGRGGVETYRHAI